MDLSKLKKNKWYTEIQLKSSNYQSESHAGTQVSNDLRAKESSLNLESVFRASLMELLIQEHSTSEN